ncbi:MAG: ATP-dependent DNA ligase [Roseovarius sp.]|nr:ATP-dependent DNA ligase [Roseovarius sp.]
MKDFAALYAALDQSTRTTVKLAALESYFRSAPDADRLWCAALFSGRRPRRAITTTRLRDWAAERAGLPLWLFEDSYAVVGDLAETIALVLPAPATRHDQGLAGWMACLRGLSGADEATRKAQILAAWDGMAPLERLVFNKLLTGGFRVGVSRRLMTRALAAATERDEVEIAHRLMGDWTPETTTWAALIDTHDPADSLSRPYPFCLAYGLEGVPEALGAPGDWLAEWKWDGIRGQVIARGGQIFIWSRGEELITDRFPELARLRDLLPEGTVIDGEILAHDGAAPLPFAALQKRITRKSVPKSLLREAPATLMAYDLLEEAGRDLRGLPFTERRARLDALVSALPEGTPLRPSPAIPFATWDALAATRATARDHRAEGLMLKRRSGRYHAGRKKGFWWKWKLDPLTLDAVMIYAQAGHGRRANLYTDFTFAVRDGAAFVPFTRAYSGLTDAEFRQITAWVRRNTVERFGPVRQVRPEQVFEIAFEGIQASPRHKSGVALRFPRMARWRQDKPATEIDTLDTLRALLAHHG